MISFAKGQAPECIYDFVLEAVGALGYFRPDAITALTNIYLDLWPHGTSAHMLNQADFMALLSEKGVADPGQASRATTLRITFNVDRWRDAQNEPHWRQYCERMSFSCMPNACCSDALTLRGEVRAVSDRAALPLTGCDKEWCACQWEQVIDE